MSMEGEPTDASHGSIDGIEQIQAKYEILLEQANNSEDSVETRKQLWQRCLALWTKMLQLAVEATKADQALFENCTSTFSAIITRLDIDKLITIDSSIAQETFFGCLNLLDMPAIHQYVLDNGEANTAFSDICFINFQYLLILCSSSCTYVPLNDDLAGNYVTILDVLRINVEKKILSSSSTKKRALDPIANCILSLFWNMADRTILVPVLLRIGLAASAVQWLTHSAALISASQRPLISIIHNIARHDDGADELNKHEAIESVKAYQRTDEVKKDSKLSLLSSIALAELSTPEQLKQNKKGMNGVLNQLLQLIMDASKTNDFRATGVAFHVSEPLAVLVKLFVVDERTLDYILVHAETEPPSDMASTIKLFANLLISFSDSIIGKDRLNQFTCIALFNIIWSISFQLQYQDELKENTDLTNIIKNLANDDGSQVIDQYKPRSMQSVKKAADGILYNLSEQTSSTTVKFLEGNVVNTLAIASSIAPPIHHSMSALSTDVRGTHRLSTDKNQSAATDDKPLIMFSYAHADGGFCRQVLNHIEQQKEVFKVWVDFQQCGTGDPWELIADGIERADVIVCFISEYYKQSNSCRQEFTYAADDLRKPIVPILMENYKPRGWLGIRKAGMNYIRFRDVIQPKHIEMKNLIDRVRVELLNHRNVPVNSATPLHHEIPSSPTRQKSPAREESQSTAVLAPIHRWTLADIHLWFAQHCILEQLRDLYQFRTGPEMLDYAQDLVNDRPKQQQIYSSIFAKKYDGDQLPPHEFNRFAKAMEHLLQENSSGHSVDKQTVILPTSKPQTKSGACVIV